jgi:hypothetical protein
MLLWKDYFYPGLTLLEQVDVIFKATTGFVIEGLPVLCSVDVTRTDTTEMKSIRRVAGHPLQDERSSRSI